MPKKDVTPMAGHEEATTELSTLAEILDSLRSALTAIASRVTSIEEELNTTA